MLPGKREEVLDNSLCTLGLLVQFGNKFLHMQIQRLALQQLSVAADRGERVVQFVGDSRNQTADSGHLLALQELFLSAPQIFVRLSGFLVKLDFVDGGGNLASDGDHNVFFGRPELAGGTAAGAKHAQNFSFSPQDHPYQPLESLSLDEFPRERRRTSYHIISDDLGMVSLDALDQFRRHDEFAISLEPGAAMTVGGPLA